jgi:hypothetical protein
MQCSLPLQAVISLRAPAVMLCEFSASVLIGSASQQLGSWYIGDARRGPHGVGKDGGRCRAVAILRDRWTLLRSTGRSLPVVLGTEIEIRGLLLRLAVDFGGASEMLPGGSAAFQASLPHQTSFHSPSRLPTLRHPHAYTAISVASNLAV